MGGASTGGSVGGSAGGASTGGGMRAGGGGFRRRSPSTGSNGDGSGSGAWFIPGSDGNLQWNTTQPIGEKPILLYVFNGHIFEGPAYDYSANFELDLLAKKDDSKELLEEARAFVCEKVCLSDHEFLRQVKGREAVSEFLASKMGNLDQRKVHVLLLDSKGKLIQALDGKKPFKGGIPGLLKAMRAAREENARRLAAQPTDAEPVEPAPQPVPAPPKKV